MLFSSQFNQLQKYIENSKPIDDIIIQSFECCKAITSMKDYERYKKFRHESRFSDRLTAEIPYIDNVIKSAKNINYLTSAVSEKIKFISSNISLLNQSAQLFDAYIKDYHLSLIIVKSIYNIQIKNSLNSEMNNAVSIINAIPIKIVNNEKSIIKLKDYIADTVSFLYESQYETLRMIYKTQIITKVKIITPYKNLSKVLHDINELLIVLSKHDEVISL